MRETRLIVRLFGLGEARAEGLVAVAPLAIALLALGLLARWPI